MALGMVAENSTVWRWLGTAARTLRIAGRKPMSSIWSASSSTTVSTPSRRTTPVFMWSSSRPGVATSTSTPRAMARICGPGLAPPTTSAVLGFCRPP